MSGWKPERGDMNLVQRKPHRTVDLVVDGKDLLVDIQETYRGVSDKCCATVPLDELCKLLSRAGLTLIGPEDAAVLEAMSGASPVQLQWCIDHEFPGHWLHEACQAELARRAAKETPRG